MTEIYTHASKHSDDIIGHYPSMWIVAKINGRWGVQTQSSFAP